MMGGISTAITTVHLTTATVGTMTRIMSTTKATPEQAREKIILLTMTGVGLVFIIA